MAKNNNVNIPKLTPWFNETCQNSRVHEELKFFNDLFEKHFREGKTINVKDVNLFDRLSLIDEKINHTGCVYLYAYAIEVLKKSAFLQIPEGSTFVRTCYSMITKFWKDNYPKKIISQQQKEDFFSSDRLLNSWKNDLDGVNSEYLCSYSEILGCQGLDKLSTFKQAVDVLSDKINGIVLDDSNLNAADESGFSLCKLLYDLAFLKKNKPKCLEVLMTGYNVSITLAKKGKNNAIQKFAKTLDTLGKPKLKKDFDEPIKSSEFHFEVYKKIAKELSDEFMKARESEEQELCDLISGLKPKLINKSRYPRLKAPEEMMFVGRISVDEGDIKYKEFSGVINDIDNETRLSFNATINNIQECKTIETSEETIQLGKKLFPKRILYIKDTKEKEYYIDSLIAKFDIQSKDKDKFFSIDEATIYPIRACNSEKEDELCTVVFSCEQPIVKNYQFLTRLHPIEGNSKKETKDKITNIIRFKSFPPFASGSKGIFTALIGWFKNLAVKISKDRGYMAYWTARPRIPVIESTINGSLRGPLNEYVSQRDGNLSSEEEASEGKLDYVVSRGGDKVVIELKRSVDPSQCQNGVCKQLPNYMNYKNTQYGIFVIFCFGHMYQKDSQEIVELCKLRDSVCSEKDIQIKIITINCDPPSSSDSEKGETGGLSGRFYEY